MAQIRDYTAANDVLRPTEVGVDAVAQAGRRVGAFYNQAGDSEKQAATDRARAGEALARAEGERFSSYGNIAKAGATAVDQAEMFESHQQISQGGVRAAPAIDQLTQTWNDSVKDAIQRDPNDTTIKSKFMEQTFEPWAEKFVDSFTAPGARDWAEQRVNEWRQHFDTHTAADLVTLGRIAVDSNVDKSTTAWASTALTDPSAVPMLLKTADSYISELIASHPNLSGTDAARVYQETLYKTQRQIVHAGALGAIKNSRDPEAAAKAYVAQYPQYGDAADTEQLMQAARGVAHVNAQDAVAKQGAARQAAVTDFQGKATGLMNGVNVASGSPQLPADYWQNYKQQLLTHPGADAGTMKDLYELGRAVSYRTKTNPPPDADSAVSHATAMDMLTQLRAGNLAPADAYRAYGSGKLNGPDLALIDGKMKAMQTPDGQALERREAEFAATVAPAITRGLGDQDAKQRMYDLQADVERKVADYRKGGGNPTDLFDRANPNYLGTPASLASYQKAPLQATLPALAASKSPSTTAVQPRQPGETLGAWMTRTGRTPAPVGTPPASMPSVPMSQ